MEETILEDVYIRSNKSIPEYLDVLFMTNKGCFEINVCSVSKMASYNLNEFSRLTFVTELKKKYGTLKILDARITYDNDKYFHIANEFLLVLGYQLNSTSENSTNEFWLIEHLDSINKTEYLDFLQMDKLDFSDLPRPTETSQNGS